MGWTLQQKQLASILPHITGFMSWIGSLTIIVDIIRKHRAHSRRSNSQSKPMSYHRLMLGMSFCDMCASGAWMMSTWLVPADTKHPDGSDTYATYGTEASCKAQAFFVQMGIGVPFYNLSLAIYYYLVIVKNSALSHNMERCMHFVSLGYALSTAISGLALDLYGYAAFWCWIRGVYTLERWVFWYGPLWVIIAIIIMIMSMIYFSLKKQERKQRRWSTMQPGAGQQLGEGGVAGGNTSNGGRRRSSIFGGRRSRVGNQRAPAFRASDNVKWQAFLYVGSFFLTWIFLTIVRGMQSAGQGASIPFWVLLAGVTLCPSQGFLNFLIYIRPRYKQHRERHPEIGRVVTFFRVNPLFVSCKCCHHRLSNVRSHAGGSVVRISGNIRRSILSHGKSTHAETGRTNGADIGEDLENGTEAKEGGVNLDIEMHSSAESDEQYEDAIEGEVLGDLNQEDSWHSCRDEDWNDGPAQ